MRELRERRVVITGAASGIGRAMADALRGRGHAASCSPTSSRTRSPRRGGGAARRAARRPGGPDRREQAGAGRGARGSRRRRVRARRRRVQQRRRRARAARCGSTRSNDWDWLLGVNLWGVVHGIRTFVPRMLAAGRRGPRRQHGVGGGAHEQPVHGHLQRDQARRRDAVGDAAQGAAPDRGTQVEGLGAVPGIRQHAHPRRRAQPPRRPPEPDADRAPSDVRGDGRAGHRGRAAAEPRRRRGWSTPSSTSASTSSPIPSSHRACGSAWRTSSRAGSPTRRSRSADPPRGHAAVSALGVGHPGALQHRGRLHRRAPRHARSRTAPR